MSSSYVVDIVNNHIQTFTSSKIIKILSNFGRYSLFGCFFEDFFSSCLRSPSIGASFRVRKYDSVFHYHVEIRDPRFQLIDESLNHIQKTLNSQVETLSFKSAKVIDKSSSTYDTLKMEDLKDRIFEESTSVQVLFPPKNQALFDFIIKDSDGIIWILQTFYGFFHNCNIEVLDTLIANQHWDPHYVRFVFMLTTFSEIDFQDTEIRISDVPTCDRKKIYETLISRGLSFYDGIWSLKDIIEGKHYYLKLPFVNI